jgi:hypothetical protein
MGKGKNNSCGPRTSALAEEQWQWPKKNCREEQW